MTETWSVNISQSEALFNKLATKIMITSWNKVKTVATMGKIQQSHLYRDYLVSYLQKPQTLLSTPFHSEGNWDHKGESHRLEQ